MHDMCDMDRRVWRSEEERLSFRQVQIVGAPTVKALAYPHHDVEATVVAVMGR